MFYLFGSTGKAFHGTLEALRRVEKTSAISSVRKAVNSGDVVDSSGGTLPPGEPSDYTASSNNAKQYGDMLVQQGSREVVNHAYQIMTQPALCIASHWVLAQVVDKFRSCAFQVFPIVDDRQQLVGLLSRTHFYEFLLSEDARLSSSSSSVAECFVTPNSSVYCADPVTDVRRIATLLVEKNLDAIPVAEENGRLVGIVSRTDILKCAIADPPLSLWC